MERQGSAMGKSQHKRICCLEDGRQISLKGNEQRRKRMSDSRKEAQENEYDKSQEERV